MIPEELFSQRCGADNGKYHEIDPAIKSIIEGIQSLPFVCRTTVSCSGHIPSNTLSSCGGMFDIKYSSAGDKRMQVQEFHDKLRGVTVKD